MDDQTIIKAAIEVVAHHAHQGNDNSFWMTVDALEELLMACPEYAVILERRKEIYRQRSQEDES